jgi:Tol biopolymer transport system component
MLGAILLTFAYAQNPMSSWPDSVPADSLPGETHLRNIRQLTFGGQNAEAYWSSDGQHLTFQSRQPGYPDEQIFTMNVDGSNKQLISTGKGRCTCSYFLPDMSGIVFSSTHEKAPGAQPPTDMSKGYVWMVNPNYSLYRTDLNGSNLRKLIDLGRYVAETTIAPNGKYLTFTSDYEGDLEIYKANLDGSHIVRLTHHHGYDGGPFVSWDSKWIVYRRDTLPTPQSVKDYDDLLAQNLVRPDKLEICMMDSNGGRFKQITHLNSASFAPFLTPDNKKVIFSTNYGDPKGMSFELYLSNVDGTGLEKVTRGGIFESFPMFTADGKKLVWVSARNAKNPTDTNIFVADWVP